jgi:hypothetical protein
MLSWLTTRREEIFVFTVALLVRLYHLSLHPLWLDEIYGYQLGNLGIGGILRNSLTDPHPPLYYFLQWASAGFGYLHHEVAWRWLPAVSGACTVAVVYRLARLQVSWLSAMLASMLLVVSPMHLFYSQEARSFAFVTLIAAISMLLLYHLHKRPQHRLLWVVYLLVSLVGIYSSYSFVLVISMQLLYLAVVERFWVPTLRYALLLGACCLPLVVPFLSTLSSVNAEHTASAIISNVLEIAQALVGGDPVRYGFSEAHLWLPGALLPLAYAGIWLRHVSGSRAFVAYLVLQGVLPFFLFFVVLVPLFQINFILTEAKQFIVLLPAWFVLAAHGIEQLWGIRFARLGQSAAIALCVVVLAASIERIQHHWEVPKSPEGNAVLYVRAHKQPDDAVVSLHYSLDAALSFYMHDTLVYTKPRQHEETYLFTDVTHVLWRQPVPGQFDGTIPLTTIRSHPRIWLLTHTRHPQPVAPLIAQGCTVSGTWDYSPFQVTLLEDCS